MRNENEAVEIGCKLGATAGAGYAYWTGALLALKTASAAQLTSLSSFLYASPLPLSVTLPVIVPVVTGAIVGGGVTYGGYKLYGMLSGSSNVTPNPSQNQNNVLGAAK